MRATIRPIKRARRSKRSFTSLERKNRHYAAWGQFTAEKDKAIGLFSHKWFIIGIILITILGVSTAAYLDPNNSLFHHNVQGQPRVIGDPFQNIWTAQATTEFNLVNVGPTTAPISCVGQSDTCMSMRPTATQTAVALSKSQIGDLSPAFKQTLFDDQEWTAQTSPLIDQFPAKTSCTVALTCTLALATFVNSTVIIVQVGISSCGNNPVSNQVTIADSPLGKTWTLRKFQGGTTSGIYEFFTTSTNQIASDTITVTVSNALTNCSIDSEYMDFYGANLASPFDSNAGMPFSAVCNSCGPGGTNTVTYSTSQAADMIFVMDLDTFNGNIASLTPSPTWSVLNNAGRVLDGARVTTSTQTNQQVTITVTSNSNNEMIVDAVTSNLSCCGTSNNPFGFYLTTNSTLPTQAGYNPYTDPAVAMIGYTISNGGGAGGTFTSVIFIQRQTSTNGVLSSIGSQDTGNCASSSSCYLLKTYTPITTPNTGEVRFLMQLNYTGASTTNHLGTCSGFQTTPSPGCSFLFYDRSFDYTNSTVFPWLPIVGSSQYYAGFFSLAGQPSIIQFHFPPAGTTTTLGMNIGLYYCGSNCVIEAPSLDTGGAFGPLIKALVNLGVFILNAILGFIAFLGPAISTAIQFLESLIETLLNAIGNILGFGNVGTDFFNLLNGIVTFFTTYVPSTFSNFGTGVLRWLDSLNIYFQWVPIAFQIASNIMGIGINGFAEVLRLVFLGFELVTGSYIVVLLLFYFVYTGDDALGGFLAFTEFFEWLVFGLGVKYLFVVANFSLDVITAVIGTIPKPMVQMIAHRFPRFPIVDVDARFVSPSFDLGELISGNMFSVWLWVGGVTFLAFYEKTTPALPGSIGAVIPSLSASVPAALAGIYPLLEIVFLLTSGIAFIMYPIIRLGALVVPGLGAFTPGPGRHISGGPGKIRFAPAKKHFQKGLEKRLAKSGKLKQAEPVESSKGELGAERED